MKFLKSKLFKKLFPYLLYLTIIIFFIYYLRNIDYSVIKSISLNVVYLLPAALFSLFFRYWGVLVWRSILGNLGAKKVPSFFVMAYIYAKSWMARYIPGSVTWLASKVFLAKDMGISKSRLATSSLLEAGVQISSLATVSLLILYIDGRISEMSPLLQIVALLVGLASTLVLLPPIFNRLLSFGSRVIKKTDSIAEAETNFKAIYKSYLMYAVGAFISGASYYFITKSIQPQLGLGDFFYITAAFNLAGVLGMATPFVPSGLGVRDGVQLLLLSIIFPVEIAIVLTVLSRLWTALVDLLFLLISYSFTKLKSEEDSIL